MQQTIHLEAGILAWRRVQIWRHVENYICWLHEGINSILTSSSSKMGCSDRSLRIGCSIGYSSWQFVEDGNTVCMLQHERTQMPKPNNPQIGIYRVRSRLRFLFCLSKVDSPKGMSMRTDLTKRGAKMIRSTVTESLKSFETTWSLYCTWHESLVHAVV